jgi:hypothetical protein
MSTEEELDKRPRWDGELGVRDGGLFKAGFGAEDVDVEVGVCIPEGGGVDVRREELDEVEVGSGLGKVTDEYFHGGYKALDRCLVGRKSTREAVLTLRTNADAVRARTSTDPR